MAAILGLDIGEKRIGVAISDSSGSMALPLQVILFEGKQRLLASVLQIAKEYSAEQVVVGLPITLKGEKGIAAQKIEALVRWLEKESALQWIFWDERLTTAEVEKFLIAADVSREKRKQVKDKLAAQRILQNYLDSRIFKSRDSVRTES